MTDALQHAVDSGYETQLEAKARVAVSNLTISQDWESWLTFGEYVAHGRNECMLRAGTNEPVGLKYNRAMTAWLADRAWVCDIDKVSRAHAVWAWENREALTKLRLEMGSNRQKKNHPTVMKRAFEASQRQSERAAPTKTGTSKADIENQLIAITDDRDKWKKKAEQSDMLFDLKSDNVKMIVGVIANEVSMNKLRELAASLRAEYDRRSKIKNGGAK